MVQRTVIKETIVPTVPDQETFTQFWDKVREAGIMGLGYGVVKPVALQINSDDYRYVVSPELSSNAEGEPMALDTLFELLNHTIGRKGNGVVPYSYTSPQGNANETKGVWEVTLVLHYNPSAPSLYLPLRNETLPLQVHNKSGLEVWEQLKEALEYNGIPREPNFDFDDSRLSEFADTSIRNIYVLKRFRSHWQAINKRVVMEDR